MALRLAVDLNLHRAGQGGVGEKVIPEWRLNSVSFSFFLFFGGGGEGRRASVLREAEGESLREGLRKSQRERLREGFQREFEGR